MYQHLKYQYKVLKTDFIVKKLEAKIVKAKSEGNQDEVKKLTTDKDSKELEVQGYQSKLNEFKSREALAESFPQTVLQLTIKVKEGINKIWSLGFVAKSAILTSALTLVLSLAGLTVSLPFYVHGEKRIQSKSFSLLYLKVLPLTIIGVLPRIFVLVMLFSVIYVANAWLAVAILLPMLAVFGISYWAILVFCVRPNMLEEIQEQDTKR